MPVDDAMVEVLMEEIRKLKGRVGSLEAAVQGIENDLSPGPPEEMFGSDVASPDDPG